MKASAGALFAGSRRSHRARSWLFVGLVVIVLAAILGVVWLGADRPLAVTVATVAEGAGDSGGATVLNASGYVTARRQATVRGSSAVSAVLLLTFQGLEFFSPW